MEETLFGTHIKNRREALGLSQEELAAGLCSVSNLSRIENNEQIPSRNTATYLLERLGLSDDLLFTMVSQKDTAVRALIREIRNDMIQCRRMPAEEQRLVQAEIREKLTELEKKLSPKDCTGQQFLLSSWAVMGRPERKFTPEEQLAMQMEAIRLTHPKFDPDHFEHGRYSMDESKLIGQIANSYSEVGERRKAIDIYRQLLRYIEKNDQKLTGYGGHFCLVAHNYAIDLTLEQRYAEAIEIAEQGRKTGIYYGSRQFLPGFVAIQAECYACLGEKEKSKELYLQAYYTYKTFEDTSNLQNMRREMKKYLDIEMPG